jgi:hypothetical protein
MKCNFGPSTLGSSLYKSIEPLPRGSTVGLKGLGRLAEEGPVRICPAGVTSLIKRGALSGKEPLHERLGAFESLERSGDTR